jgi:hypothetical protein
MKYQKRYEALKDDNEYIGPLRIPIIPPGINPDDILPLVIEERKKREEERKRPYSPLIIPENTYFPPEEPNEEVKNDKRAEEKRVC